jgi:hypothetical protein
MASCQLIDGNHEETLTGTIFCHYLSRTAEGKIEVLTHPPALRLDQLVLAMTVNNLG